MSRRRLTLRVAANVGLASVYFLAAKLGLSLAFANPSATPVWPPTGIALVAVLFLGPGICPAIFIGAFLANLTTQGTVLTSLGIATGNTLEAALGASLMHRFCQGTHVLERIQSILRFLFLVVILSTMVSASIGVASLYFGGFIEWSKVSNVWITWWFGDMGGAMVVAPFLLSWLSDPSVWNRKKIIHLISVLFLVFFIAEVIFRETWISAPVARYTFLSIPPLLWAAFQFGQRGSTTATAILWLVAVWGTLDNLGPFAVGNANESLILLQVYTSTIATAALMLAAASTERKQANEHLRAALREKEILLREIHHRVKNNLQVISSLLSLQADASADRGFHEKVRESQNRIKAMALVHENLNQSQSFAQLQLRPYLKRLVEELLKSYNPKPHAIAMKLEVDDAAVSIDTAIPCGLIVNELVSNAAKHAFSGGKGGALSVRLHQDLERQELTLRVSDDGPGLPKNFDFQKAESLGLRLVRALILQLNGQVSFDSNEGTQVTIIFPTFQKASSARSVMEEG